MGKHAAAVPPAGYPTRLHVTPEGSRQQTKPAKGEGTTPPPTNAASTGNVGGDGIPDYSEETWECVLGCLLAYLPPRPSPTSDRVKRVLEGKAVVRVVDVGGPLSSFATLVRASGLVADKSLSTTAGARVGTGTGTSGVGVCDLLVEGMRSLTLGKEML